MACRKDGLRPGEVADLSRLRGIGSTGSPLPAEGFRYVYDAISPSVHLQSVSGGTDVCTAFVGASPLVPVWEGEIIVPAPRLRGRGLLARRRVRSSASRASW